MVLINDWNEFEKRAIALYTERPNETRYVTKYRHEEGTLIVKVTDNNVCLKYATTKLGDLKKVDKLNLEFLKLMVNAE